jgi:2-oxoisovalerate dehydrogenase E2 component (dihydrolipoyl transacylase)
MQRSRLLRRSFVLSNNNLLVPSLRSCASPLCFATCSNLPPILSSQPPLLTTSISCHSGIKTSHRTFRSTTVSRDIIPFKLTDVGEGITQCEVLKWNVKVGDQIDEFDSVCELQSDKATVEVTSRFKGVVTKIYYKVGELAKVGNPLIDIDTGDSAHPKATASQSEVPVHQPEVIQQHQGSSSPPAPSAPFRNEGLVLTTPAVRRIAKENNIDLRTVRGSGKDGRVMKEDVLLHIENLKGHPQVAASIQMQQQQIQPQPQVQAQVQKQPQPEPQRVHTPTIVISGQDREVEIRGLQRTMVKTMTQANTIPHFGYCDEVELDQLVILREELKPIAESRGVKLSYMPFILKATSLALKQYPILNSSVNADVTKLIYKASHNLGIAMDTPQGLLVPNIKNVQALSIFEIAGELNRLHKLGLEGKLGKDDLSGGTFSLSNIGSIGGTYAKPVLVPPEVAIGALGKIQRLPRFSSDRGPDSDRIVAKRLMMVSWSADHRVIDGATMANFSNLWKKYLENPKTMLIDLR